MGVTWIFFTRPSEVPYCQRAILNFLSYCFWLHTPKCTAKASVVNLLGFNTLKLPNCLFLSLKGTMSTAFLFIWEFLGIRVPCRLIVSHLFCKGINNDNLFWEQGWRNGESTHLSPMWPGFDSWTRGWVVDALLWEVFLQVLRFSPVLKNQHFQIPILSWIAWTFLNEFLWTP